MLKTDTKNILFNTEEQLPLGGCLFFKEGETMQGKDYLSITIGAMGGILTTLFGGWTAGMVTLVIFMCIDYVTGFVVAAVFKKSKKSSSGALESKAGWVGLCKKGMILLFVLIAYRLDLMIGTNYIRDAAVIGFCVNELVSITENAGLMGIPLPKVIQKAIDVLVDQTEGKDE